MPPTVDDPFGHGSLCDVEGVHVGHHHRIGGGWQTGTTAVIVPAGAVAAVDVRGGGPGTRETDALASGNLVDRVHGVCLTGGSAYGLAAAHGVVTELERRRLGVPVGDDPRHVVPVVPAAVIFDLGRGGAFAKRPTPEFGRRAARGAGGSAARGSVGAGTGARAGGLQGGVGMASTVVELAGMPITVAALVVLNAAGDVVDRSTGLPFERTPGLRRPDAAERRAYVSHREASEAPPPLNTTIGVVATTGDLTRPEAGRLAMAAHDGIARSVRPAHTLVDGDAVFALATGRDDLGHDDRPLGDRGASRTAHLNRLAAAAADVFAMACVDALTTATSHGTTPSYRGLCPSAFRALPEHSSRR